MAHKNLRRVDVHEPTPQDRRLAWWVENSLIRTLKAIYNALGEYIRELFSFSLTDWVDDIEQGLLNIMTPWLDYVQSLPGLPNSIQETIRRARSGESQAGVILIGLLATVLVMVIQGPVSTVLGRPVFYGLNRFLRNEILDPSTTLNLYQRRIISESTCQGILRYHGFTDEVISNLLDSATVLVTDDILTQGLWRGFYGKGFIEGQLRARGMSQGAIDGWFAARELIPSPSDLVGIATREGFDDQIARQFGYDENYPALAASWAEKQGMGQDWFKRLWRAHWRLPGTNQGYEMLHRGIINLEQLRLLLRASDIPEFWREALIKLSYSPITRVDVRRIYARGIISTEDVFDRYLALGYSPEDSQAMTEWTVAEYIETERDLTKTDILRLFGEGVINENECTQYLIALNYREFDIALLIAREELKRNERYEKEIIENVRALYLIGEYSRTDVFAQLGQLNPPSGFVENKLAIWDLEKRRRVTRPTVTQLRDFWLDGIITESELETELQNRGYVGRYIDWYKQLWTQE